MPLPVTTQTFYAVTNGTGSASLKGKAFLLYSFYTVEAVRQESSQPLATDDWCAHCLGFDIKAVREARKFLTEIGLIEHIVKRSRGFRYVRVHYLPVTLPNVNPMQLDTIKQTGFLGDFYSQWYERMMNHVQILKRRIEQRLVQKSVRLRWVPDYESINNYCELIFQRIEDGVEGVMLCERDFVYYVIDSVINEARNEEKRVEKEGEFKSKKIPARVELPNFSNDKVMEPSRPTETMTQPWNY